MRRNFVILLLVLSASVASAIVTRATYLRKSAFRDAPGICLKPVDPGQGNPVSAFDVSVVICPQVDPTQIENPDGMPCQAVTVPAWPATAAQKNWVKSAWSMAHNMALVPEAAGDAP